MNVDVENDCVHTPLSSHSHVDVVTDTAQTLDGVEDKDSDNLATNPLNNQLSTDNHQARSTAAPHPTVSAIPSSNLITMPTKHMVFFAGLRGAVAFACANIFPKTDNADDHRQVVVATTTAIILITIFIQGGLTPLVVKFLGVPTNCDANQYVESVSKETRCTSILF
jgi:Sodium/hydrogen exchanger family